MKILGLIPTRLGSTRLPSKPLLEINNIPLIIHTYKRAKMSKLLDDVIICCDDIKILNIAKKFNAKAILTSKKHKNGTERIAEGFLKQKNIYDLIVDIQGDEPLLNPKHIDQVVKFHKKNLKIDIVLPSLKLKTPNSSNVVKVITDIKDNVIFLSRLKLPLEFKNEYRDHKKHLSIISFRPAALIKFAKSKKTPLEKSEDVELLRALEIGLKIKTLLLKGNSFSVDVLPDFKRAIQEFKKDKLFKNYK
jgi:3-deoxy-manno-octulosonate cytidylyltransferase (CMP-KDO synthetase)